MKKFLIVLFLLMFTPAFAEEIKENITEEDLKTEAYALYNTNQSQKAIEIFKQIPEVDYNETTLLILANCYEDIGDIKKAIYYLNYALVKNKKFYKGYYNLGCIYLKEKKYELAIKYFKLTKRYKWDFAYADYNLGCAYLELKKYRTAKGYFLRAISSKTKDKNFYINLAYTYKMLGNSKSAKKILEEVK